MGPAQSKVPRTRGGLRPRHQPSPKHQRAGVEREGSGPWASLGVKREDAIAVFVVAAAFSRGAFPMRSKPNLERT
eukprot:657198-Lingulodinium_polyedra.AAC.1